MSGKYRPIDEVRGHHRGLPVRLVLEMRETIPTDPHYAVCWRTLYPSGKTNRRYYCTTQDGFWKIPRQLALKLMGEAHVGGMLDPQHDDRFRRWGGGMPCFTDSRNLGPAEYSRSLAEISMNGFEPQWGQDPLFMIAQEGRGPWRKIMIVSRETREATFRSTTTEVGRRGALRMNNGTDWRLDNSMMDCSTAIMREFLGFLRAICAAPPSGT